MKKNPHVTVEQSNHFAFLECPSCKETYLHQRMVEVYNRTEDADIVWATLVDTTGVLSHTIPNSSSNNPSNRRQGLVIHFECEHCQDEDLKLCIAQHKGSTLMHWEYGNGNDTGS